MNQSDQNINKDMLDSDLIDVESLDYSDDQTWLYSVPDDSGQKVDIVDWNLSCDWPISDNNEYFKLEKLLFGLLDNIIKFEAVTVPDKHKFDSRTFVKLKKRPQRPSIQSIVEGPSNPPSMSPHPSLQQSPNKYLTYNKYSMPLGPISPMLRLKTFNVDANTDNSNAIKEYAMKRRSLVQDDDPQLEDIDLPLTDSSGHVPSKPINIDLSQPAHNLHNTFNKGLTNFLNERGSLNMYQSGESLMRMSPPSLVSSLLMESSGTFNPESIESRKSMPSQRDSGFPTPGRDSRDPMLTSMTLSILDEKDMSTSFLSQTTYPDNDSLNDSLPPSLVSSVNSSYIVSNSFKVRPDTDSNIFSSATFTHLDQSEKLLSGRPRCQLYNNVTKRESMRNSESYTKSREEACQIDKVLNENSDKKSLNSIGIPKLNSEMGETITLHYANNKFRKDKDAEKENFERDDTFFKDMGLQKPEEVERNSLNVTLGKQELNEIIQARQKLSLARKALPTEPDKQLPNQTDPSPVKTIQLPNQTITVPRQSMENASELLSKRRSMNANGHDHRQEEPTRELPKRSATFKKPSPPLTTAMDTTVVFLKGDDNQMIDINSATLNLIDGSEKTLHQEEWCLQERAMVGSSESTDTGTFSSSSPPDSVPDTALRHDPSSHIASTPLMSLKKGAKNDLLNIHSTISPIYDMVDDKSYTLTKALSTNTSGLDHNDLNNTTVINSATMVKKSSVKRDILTGKASPDRKMFGPGLPQRSSPTRISPTSAVSYGSMVPPQSIPRKTSLPTSKLRQYSSHRELSRIPGGNTGPPARSGLAGPAAGRLMSRRAVYASNPALSPTASAPPVQTNSYTLAVHPQKDDRPRPVTVPPPLVRQGTETLRRERPQSHLVAPRDVRGNGGLVTAMRNHHIPPPTTRPYSIAGATQLRVAKPAPGPVQKLAPAPPAVVEQPRPAAAEVPRASGLPRPSRLPAPRRALRPPSVYSVAPAADMDHY